MTQHNIFLIGFSGTGKSAIGRRLARRLDREHLDTDDEIVARSGLTIPEIFEKEGEKGFRAREREVLEEVCQRQGLVVSTGGGIALHPGNRASMAGSGVIVCLEAKPSTIYKRLSRHLRRAASGPIRPLLAGPDPLKRIESIKEYRQPFYATADWTVHTDDLTTDEVVREVMRGVKYAQRRLEGKTGPQAIFPPPSSEGREYDAPYCQEMGAAFVVSTPSASYPVFVGWGILDELGPRMRNLGLSGKAAVIADEGVFPHQGARALESLEKAGFEALSFSVPAGEGSKSTEALSDIYDWLVEHRIERGDAIVALGGGMVGDLAGYAAATYLRGVPLVQAPTTLLAMTDSSIGGKVAINHISGKNLIGAFYQPRMVLADVQTLATLPPRELTSGWAEVIKHGMIMDTGLLESLENDAENVLALEPEATTKVLMRSAALKGRVVSGDEKESGLRLILNYGHTIAHALEAATDYGRLLHGEAVSIGMMGAAWISREIAGLSDEAVERQRRLLELFHLPISMPEIDIERVLGAMALDKKVKGKVIRWVLLEDLSKPVVRDDVPMDLVAKVLGRLIESR
ncbi:MAG: 3-dehydroquinate synthase [Chloroflexi bacterium]|nr:3-dehydroquinate synthase [Chloroflexota bacterium]